MNRRSGLTLTLVVLGVALWGCSRNGAEDAASWEAPPPLEVEVVPVAEAPITETLRLNGSLIPLRFANIVSEVDGVIKDIPDAEEKIQYKVGDRTVTRGVTLDIGHHVKKRQILVEIDPTDCQLALEAAQAKLALARGELAKLNVWRREEERRQLKAQYDEAVALLERCEKDRERGKTLIAKNAISKEEYDRVMTACSVAVAVQERAKAAWDVAQAGPTKEEIVIAEANVALAQAEVNLRQEKLNKCTIRAPYDAVIAERYVGVGDRVTALPRVEIMQIIDPSLLFAEVAVPERYQGRIHIGAPARLRARGVTDLAQKESAAGNVETPKAAVKDFVPAVVGLVNDKIDPQTRTFRVRVGFENDRGLFKAGTFAQVELTIDSAPRAVVVPARAVTFADGQPVVFLLSGERVKRRPVRLGIVSRDQQNPEADKYEVLAGLVPGDRVVVGSATAMLADGMAVRPRDAAPAGKQLAAVVGSEASP